MTDLVSAIGLVQSAFSVSTEQLHTVAASFQRDMEAGLAARDSSLAMLPSYLHSPSGREHGLFLALDFGGTNVRFASIELLGNGSFNTLARHTLPLADPAGKYNFTTAITTAEDLFSFIASQLAKLTNRTDTYLLGHTFSFPCRQLNPNSAILLHWTKEISTSGVEGHNIVELLNKALQTKGFTNIRPAVILNDSVSTLIAAAYKDKQADIGAICGTGYNACYLEPHPPTGAVPMYINIEAGNFTKIPGNNYDTLLDYDSEKPGVGHLEKMCAGRYIGELFRLALLDFAARALLCRGHIPEFLFSSGALTGADLAICLADTTADLQQIGAWFSSNSFRWELSYADRCTLRAIALPIVIRSARLVTATHCGILKRLDPQLARNHTIAIDGSLYEKMPFYAQTVRTTLQELLGPPAARIQYTLSKDGSALGAAVAAATIQSQEPAAPI